jgi:hypothetical protein
MADLGDLSDFLKEGAVSNLDWLDVDAEEYRKHVETLPKQNLDVIPDLEAAWAHADESPSIYAVPNVTPTPPWPGAPQVHTMGDLSQAHGRLRAKPEEIRKTARLALMQSPDLNRFKHALVSRYDGDSLKAARDVIASVLNERGLLGKVYVDSHDFPTCASGSTSAPAFVSRYAKDAKYVVAKLDCAGCSHKMQGPTGSDLCSVFHKEIQVEIPYTTALAVEVEKMQSAKGKVIAPTTAAQKPRERVRLAMLSDNFVAQYPSPQIKPVEDVIRLMKPLVASEKPVDKTVLAIVATMRREMLKGRSPSDVLQALKAAYTPQTLIATRTAWEPMFREAGLYGAVYSTQDSFEDCREGADFLAKHNPTVRAIVTGSKCESCIYNKISRCMLYGKPLVKDASALYTPEVVEAVLWEGRVSGKLPETKKASEYGSNPREQLLTMHRTASNDLPRQVQATRMDVVNAYHGSTPEMAKPVVNPVVAGVSRMLNEGLYGADLLRVVKLRYDSKSLIAAKEELRPVIAEQGLQGIFYIDPSAYDDYGKGCKEAERLHRTRLVEYAKVGSKCSGCVHQTKQGYCSVLDKTLVTEPPYYDKAAQQQQILSSGASTEIRFAELVNNGLSMMAEYDMQNRTTSFELDPEKKPEPLLIALGREAKRQ